MISTLFLTNPMHGPSALRGNGPSQSCLPISIARQMIFLSLVLGLLSVSFMAQFSSAEESNLESQEGKPCICNSTFYRHCPSGANCVEDIILDPHPDSVPGEEEHDNELIHDSIDWSSTKRMGNAHKSSLYSSFSGQAPVERHRKIYMTPRKDNWQPKLYGFKIRVPVSPPTIEPASIPAPKPVFKLRKYVTYENKKETQMVPVTKTIIKPVGVSPDQIIDEDNGGLKEKFLAYA